jgi:hypothetical protein
MDTNIFFYMWLRQSVPALVVYPPFDAPHMLTYRGTRHHRTQFLREPYQVVKQNLSLFIHDICQRRRFHQIDQLQGGARWLDCFALDAGHLATVWSIFLLQDLDPKNVVYGWPLAEKIG